MAAVTINSDFGTQENKLYHCFHFSPFYLSWSDGTQCPALSFCWMLSFKPVFSLSSLTLIKNLFSFSSLLPLEWCHLRIWGCWYFSMPSWFQFLIHPAQHFAWCTLNISLLSRVTIYSLVVLLSQFWARPCSMSASNCCFLSCIQVSQETGKVIWYSHPLKNFPQFVVIHMVKCFGVVNKAEVVFSGTPLLFLWSNRYWQFDIWFLCHF